MAARRRAVLLELVFRLPEIARIHMYIFLSFLYYKKHFRFFFIEKEYHTDHLPWTIIHCHVVLRRAVSRKRDALFLFVCALTTCTTILYSSSGYYY